PREAEKEHRRTNRDSSPTCLCRPCSEKEKPGYGGPDFQPCRNSRPPGRLGSGWAAAYGERHLQGRGSLQIDRRALHGGPQAHAWGGLWPVEGRRPTRAWPPGLAPCVQCRSWFTRWFTGNRAGRERIAGLRGDAPKLVMLAVLLVRTARVELARPLRVSGF